ncbi:MAG: response regulator, partial [Planctomycetaceae bacterium]
MTDTTSPLAVTSGAFQILLVGGDDRAPLERALREEFQTARIVEADGEAALRDAVTGPLPPDVVVIDETHRWSESRAALDAVRRMNAEIPVVMTWSADAAVAVDSCGGVAPSGRYVVGLAEALHCALEQTGYARESLRREDERHRQCEDLKSVNEALAQEIDERTQTVDRRAQQLRLLASELTKAEERERRRLAQMLHDDLQQMLVAARMHISAITPEIAPSRVVELMKHVDDLLDRSIRLSRNLTHRASPPVLYDAGLAPALEWLGRQMADEHGLEVEVDCDDTAQPESQDTRILLYQACRELLFNVVKHAGAKRCKLAMHRAGDGDVQVSVCDEGKGFDAERSREIGAGDGFGLFSIRERLELTGGRMEIESIPDEGSCVRLYAPVKMTEEERNGAADLGRTLVEALDKDLIRPLPEFTGKPIRVLLADDHRIMRASLAGLLRDQPGIEVVGQAGDGQEVIDKGLELRPDVIVMDVTMPIIDGVEATRRLTAELPDLFVIALSMHEKDDMQRAMRNAGAKRYLTKDGPPEMLIAAIRSGFARRGEK